jgi:Cytochrome P450
VIKSRFTLTQAQEEVDRVLGDRQQPSMADYQELRYTMRCVVSYK